MNPNRFQARVKSHRVERNLSDKINPIDISFLILQTWYMINSRITTVMIRFWKRRILIRMVI